MDKSQGLNMPIKILQDNKLNFNEKFIVSFSMQEECTITNAELACILRMSASRVEQILSGLIKRGYIDVLTDDTHNQRIIKYAKSSPE